MHSGTKSAEEFHETRDLDGDTEESFRVSVSLGKLILRTDSVPSSSPKRPSVRPGRQSHLCWRERRPDQLEEIRDHGRRDRGDTEEPEHAVP